jgi:hypothetical protein
MGRLGNEGEARTVLKGDLMTGTFKYSSGVYMINAVSEFP